MMENRILKKQCQSASGLRNGSNKSTMKFKQISLNSGGRFEFNELHSKYQVYKMGTPNEYSQELESMKANNIKSEIRVLEMPAIESIIEKMGKTNANNMLNQRNFELYPNLLKTGTGKFKELLSDKREIKDFTRWFQTQFQQIQKSTDNPKRFHDKQTLIASGFHQITTQIAKISKSRADILKTLWNHQNQEISQIIEALNTESMLKQKGFLFDISNLHEQYQSQIEKLTKCNKQLQKQHQKESLLCESSIQTLRILRRRIKKEQYIIKKLNDVNINSQRQNLHLMEENIKLMMSVKDISAEEARILNYRRLQVNEQVHNFKKNKKNSILKLINDEINKQIISPVEELQLKKQRLYEYFLERMRENPIQRLMINEDFFFQNEDEHSGNGGIENYFKKIIDSKVSVQLELLNEAQIQQTIRKHESKKEKGVNTIRDYVCSDHIQTTWKLCYDKALQINMQELDHEQSELKLQIEESQQVIYPSTTTKSKKEYRPSAVKSLVRSSFGKNPVSALHTKPKSEVWDAK